MKRRLRRAAVVALAVPALALAAAPAASAATTAGGSTDAVAGGSSLIIDIGVDLEIGAEVWIDGILYIYLGGGVFTPA